tara:strand:+ start:188 stop:499 length:312 start_codon:yes stop_codon:yes gene_type:complete
MLFAESLTGIILIISGVLVKKYPNLIAGYNTLSEAEKKKIDIKHLSGFMRNCLIIIGAVSIIVTIALYFIGVKNTYRFMVTTGIVVIGLIYMLAQGTTKKYDF